MILPSNTLQDDSGNAGSGETEFFQKTRFLSQQQVQIMPRERYITQLNSLRNRVLAMGSLVEENVVRATESFVKRDLVVSAELVAADQAVNTECISINMDILQMIALQQPIAGDMRLLAASLEIVDELERIHDYVKSVGKISVNP